MSAAGFTRFVAIGDSQTEGIGDMPNGDGSARGWADRFAERLAQANPQLLYANLAVRGRRVAQVYAEQFGPALRMEPDLVSVIAGMNDLIRPGFDMDFTLALMDEMESTFRARGATVLTITYPDPDGLGPIGRLLEDRIRTFNQGIREVARANGTTLLDLEPIKATSDVRIWQPDRLHLNPDGHWRMAMGMLSAIGPGLADPGWDEPLPPPAVEDPVRAFGNEAEWALRYLVPWIGRRIVGRSSGDGISAKRPRLEPLADREEFSQEAS